ncbi:peptidoglycan DD-metalloendopeptidase family protein [Microbacterium sp. X-17]|uniref:peptidoglycan DD-metalloendopeptidase family protein n=1 Tax=Microbacterium sp. X-17 TaxID=3144404 RepID=UPI0031F4B081
MADIRINEVRRRTFLGGAAATAAIALQGVTGLGSPVSPAAAAGMRLRQPLDPPGRYDASDPFESVKDRKYPHTGSDWNGVPAGTPALAIGSGVVVNKQWHSGNGNTVTVALPDGHFYAYLHLDRPASVNPGDSVVIGQTIGYVGDTGTNSRGAHLHITISDLPTAFGGYGKLLDPYAFIVAHENGVDSAGPTARYGVTPLVLPGGQLALYTVRGDGNLWGTSQAAAGGSFGPLQPIGGLRGDLVGRPSVVRTQSGLIAAYARTTSGTIVGSGQSVPGGPFGPWGAIGAGGGGIASDPAAIVLKSGIIAIYATTGANTVSGVAQTVVGGGFGGWQAIGAAPVGLNYRPSVLQTSDGRIVLYAHSTDFRIFGAAQSAAGGTFGTWSLIGTGGGNVGSEPAATIDSGDRISVYATALDGTLAGVTQPSAGASFGAWTNFGSGSASLGPSTTPSVVPLSDGSHAVYVAGATGSAWGTVLVPGRTASGGWARIGTGSGPWTAVTAVRTPSGLIVAYGTDSSGQAVGAGQLAVNGAFGPWTQIL